MTKSENDEGKHYIGITGGKFKDRWASHNFSFRHEKASRSTKLSKYVWELKNKGIEPKLSWTILLIAPVLTETAAKRATFV